MELHLQGLDELLNNLRECPRRVQRTVLRKAVRAGAKPILIEMKARTPLDTRQLKKALGVRIKAYASSGTAVAVIGPRRGFKASDLRDKRGRRVTRDPSKTVHLVERGTKRRTTQHRNARVPKTRFTPFNSGATRATHFVQRATETAQASAIASMTNVLRAGIEEAWTNEVPAGGGDET